MTEEMTTESWLKMGAAAYLKDLLCSFPSSELIPAY